eukprot:2664482-Pyramimonas_sp.AAC.1
MDKHRPNGDATSALRATLDHHAVLVHGPPGTGKTTFSVACLDMWGSCLRPGHAVALAAGSNTA